MAFLGRTAQRGLVTSGPPTTGTWNVGDTIFDTKGRLWFCTVGGTPGKWATSPGTLLAKGGDTAGLSAITAETDITGATATVTVPDQPLIVTGMATGVSQASTSGGWNIKLYEGANLIDQSRKPLVAVANSGERASVLGEWDAGALTYGASYTFKLTAARITSNGSVSITAPGGGYPYDALIVVTTG